MTIKLCRVVFSLLTVMICINTILYALNNVYRNGFDDETQVNPFRNAFMVKSLITLPFHFSEEDSLFMSVSIQRNETKGEFRKQLTKQHLHQP